MPRASASTTTADFARPCLLGIRAKLALVACMRKLLLTSNAILREQGILESSPPTDFQHSR